MIRCLAARAGELTPTCRSYLLQNDRGQIRGKPHVAEALAALAPQPAPGSDEASRNPALARACADEPARVVRCIKPSDADPAIRRYDRVDYVMFDKTTGPEANLLVFLPGTGGTPPGPLAFLAQAADAGYRVISLDYNDEPSVAVYCPRRPDPSCSETFRRMRLYGDGIAMDPAIDNSAAESIVSRLVKLLQYLDAQDAGGKWGDYLDNGAPKWSRIAFAGQSQGAGMAAYLAKQHLVARVILFSSPWDFIARDGRRRLAPWIAEPSRTPPERWFAGYHARESTAALLAQSYRQLHIPPENIRVFTLGLPAGAARGTSNNPFHPEGIRDPVYAAQRAFFLGRSP